MLRHKIFQRKEFSNSSSIVRNVINTKEVRGDKILYKI